VIRLTRTIEYEYESAEDMAKDVAGWSLPSKNWFKFNGKKRARSRITSVVELEHLPDEVVAIRAQLRQEFGD
jgi:hypothetical protein